MPGKFSGKTVDLISMICYKSRPDAGGRLFIFFTTCKKGIDRAEWLGYIAKSATGTWSLKTK